MRVKKLLVTGLAVPALALAACSDGDGGDAEPAQGESSATQESNGAEDPAASGSEPDLEGIPDVVAEVNGAQITKDDFVPAFEQQFQQAASQAQMTGQAPDQDALKKQVAEQLVNTELLDQATDDAGYEATEQQVDEMLADLATSNQMGSAEEFLAALEEQGMSEEEVRSQVATQVELEQLVAAETGDLDPTRAELKEAYEAAVAQQEQAGQEAPPFEEVRSQLREQVRSQKLNDGAQTLLTDLRDGADITMHV